MCPLWRGSSHFAVSADLEPRARSARDVLGFGGFDSERQKTWSTQFMPDGGTLADASDPHELGTLPALPAMQLSRSDRRPAQHREDLDLLRLRQWRLHWYLLRHQPAAWELKTRPDDDPARALLAQPGPSRASRTVRLLFFRGPGRDFSERDWALLSTLLRPAPAPGVHGCRTPPCRAQSPGLRPGDGNCCGLVAAGHTNAQIARQLGLAEGTVRIHLGNVYERLGVSSRIARDRPRVSGPRPPRSACTHGNGLLVTP